MPITRYFYTGEESSFDTAVAGVHKFDPESVDIDSADDDKAIWAGASRVDRHVVLGPYNVAGGFNVLADLDRFPFFLKMALGGLNTSGSGPYTHVFTPDLTNLMPSFTAIVGKDNFEHVFSGCTLNSLQIQITDNFVRAIGDVLGASDEKQSLDGSPAFNEGSIFAPHDVTYNIDAGDESARVESATIEISNPDNEEGRSMGSRFPRRIYKGSTLVTVTLTLAFLDEQEMTKFWGQSSGPLTTGSPTEVNHTLNIGSNFDITMSRGVYTSFGKPLAGRGRITQDVTARFLSNSDGSGDPIQVSITNSISSY